MNKVTWALGVLLLLAGNAAGAQYDRGFPFSDDNDHDSFTRYRPFQVQIEGGPTLTQRTEARNLDNGWNAGLGITWWPSSHLPLGLRLDGSYNHFDVRSPLLNAASTQLQSPVDNGTVRIWGGDADLEIPFRLGPLVKLYLFGGVGWYDEQDTFRQSRTVNGTVCDFFGCAPGTKTTYAIVARDTIGVHFAKNAGIGMQLALSDTVWFFADARYLRIDPSSQKKDFIPIRFGVRF